MRDAHNVALDLPASSLCSFNRSVPSMVIPTSTSPFCRKYMQSSGVGRSPYCITMALARKHILNIRLTTEVSAPPAMPWSMNFS